MKVSAIVLIGIPGGLTSVMAAALSKAASQYSAQIMMKQGSRLVNAKSMIGCLSLGLSKGDEVTLTADGPDADAALEAVKAVLVGA